ncbi:MAG: hypothetical protein M1833_004285 [Piccolia ochrophora]|nr:MAG: hypothetical protein M1833_004285 [Piccolia ochrophora]
MILDLGRRSSSMALNPRATQGGIERGPLPENTVRTSLLVAMLTLAIYQCFVVNVQLFATFKRRNTLYFWAILIASWGIVSHSTGIILKWFVASCPWTVNTILSSFGWWGMVSGQSLVLYSRLHLVVRNPRILRAVFVMIIFNFCVFQVPTTIMTFGSNQENPGVWLKIYNVYERIQLIVFTLQETIISIIYIRAAIHMLQPSDPDDSRHVKKFLIYLNVLCIVLDIAFVAEVYSGEWVYKTGTQSLAYSIKLTIEFIVLNKFLEVVKHGSNSCAVGNSSNGAASRATMESSNGKGNRRPSGGSSFFPAFNSAKAQPSRRESITMSSHISTTNNGSLRPSYAQFNASGSPKGPMKRVDIEVLTEEANRETTPSHSLESAEEPLQAPSNTYNSKW